MPSIDPVSDCDPVLHAARSRVLLDEPLVVGHGETRQPHFSLLTSVADPPTALAVTAEG